MNGMILVLIALPMAALAIDTETPGFINRLADLLGKSHETGRKAVLGTGAGAGSHGGSVA